MLKRMVVTLVLPVAALLSGCAGQPPNSQGTAFPHYADSILVNGKILKVDKDFGSAQAVAIRDGKFLAVGTTEDIQKLAGPATKRIDLQGRTVLPGLIDTHAHMEDAGVNLYTVPLYRAKSVADALDEIRKFAAKTKPGEWIQGSGWHPPSQLKERRYLTRQEIDSAAPNNPVFLPTGGHFFMANSLAMKIAGISKATLNPEGGEIHKDASGEPDGLLVESAGKLVADHVPPWSPEVRATQFREAMKAFNASGLTSVVLGLSPAADFKTWKSLAGRHEATVRTSLMFSPTGELAPDMSVDEWSKLFSRMGGLSDFGNEWINFAAIKLAIDGGMTLRTALMRDAYPDDQHYHGTAVMAQDKFQQLVAICNRNGWRVGVHAVGDAGIDRVLDAFEYANKESPIVGRRFILIHASLMRQDQMDRAKKLGVRVDVQNSFMWNKAATVARFLGKPVADRAVPTRTLIERMGIENVGAGTDYPVNPMNPFINMYVMVTRKDIQGNVYGADEKITREQALRLYTSAAAGYSFEEKVKGSIEPGKLADLVVISHDLMTVPDEALKDITPVITMVGGEIVYQR
jgi:predicted amidohydrolase YtcJ